MAESKGIRLAIVGMNCYSGTLMSLKGKNTCVVSSSPEDKAAYTQFSFYFSDIMLKNNMNLEQLFLVSRRHTQAGDVNFVQPQLPQISTEENNVITEMLASVNNAIYSKVDMISGPLNPVSCKNYSIRFEDLQNKMQQLKKMAYKSIMASLDNKYIDRINQLQSKLEDYQQLVSAVKTQDADAPSSQRQNKILELEQLGSKISKDEKELYYMLYQDLAPQLKIHNPCRDFKL